MADIDEKYNKIMLLWQIDLCWNVDLSRFHRILSRLGWLAEID